MGLGKTLEAIALILARPRRKAELCTEFPDVFRRLTMEEQSDWGGGGDEGSKRYTRARAKEEAEKAKQAAAVAKAAVQAEKVSGKGNAKGRGRAVAVPEPEPEEEEDPEPVAVKGSLIVCPQAISLQWVSEVADHSRDVSVLLYTGLGSGLWAKDLAQYDIVVTTYEVLRKELRSTSARFQSPLLHCEWWRVILDEAQVLYGVRWRLHALELVFALASRWCAHQHQQRHKWRLLSPASTRGVSAARPSATASSALLAILSRQI